MTTHSVVTVTGSQNVNELFEVYLTDATYDNITLTLPPITSDGSYYSFSRIDFNGTNNVVLQGNSPLETINGAFAVNLNLGNQFSVISCGSSWFITD